VSTQHPITPPPELIRKWAQYQDLRKPESLWQTIAAKSAQWGAEQELEACIDWASNARNHGLRWDLATMLSGKLRAARRPKPPTLKEQALGALGRFNTNAHMAASEMVADFDTIRRALESLDD